VYVDVKEIQKSSRCLQHNKRGNFLCQGIQELIN